MVSVILVTYNSESVLEGCVSALKECSSASQLELIFVDNCSSDRTREWIEELVGGERASIFTALKVLYLSENHGYAYANNRGLDLANGELLLLLNPDTLVGQNAIEYCSDRLASQSEVGAVGCRLQLLGGELDRACRRSFPTLWNSLARFSGLSLLFPNSRLVARYNLSYLDEHGNYPVDCVCGAFMMVSRSVYENVGGLDEDYFMYGEDIDLCWRIKGIGYEVWYEGAVTTTHLKGRNGGKRSRQSLRNFYDTMYLYYTKTRQIEATSLFPQLLRIILVLAYYAHLSFRGGQRLLARGRSFIG